MNLQIVSPNIEINAEGKKLLHHKFSLLGKIYDRITGYEVVIRKVDTGNEYIFEIEGRVLVPKSSFFCRERGKVFENTIDKVVENLARQLKWQKEDRMEIW